MLRQAKGYLTIFLFFIHLLTAGSTSLSLDEKFGRIDSMISSAMNQMQSAGLGVGIVENGQVVFAKGYGLRYVSPPVQESVSRDQPFNIRNRFMHQSVHRVFNRSPQTGWPSRLGWQETRHMPDFKMHGNCATENVQIKDLASHNTGLPRHDSVWVGSTFPWNEFITRIPHFPPS